MPKEKKIRVAGACVTGLSHTTKGIPCQDRILSKSLNGVQVIALADGAGSYQKPDVGAEIATSFICDYLTENFPILYKKNKEDIAKEVLIELRKKLIRKSESLNVDAKELSSTILFVGVNNKQFIAGHIGDGMIGYYKEKDVKPLSLPDNENEYTVFPMSKDALSRFRIYKNNLNDIKGFILMSDGSYDSLFSTKSNNLTDANITMLQWLQDNKNNINEIESEIRTTIEKYFLKQSVNGDDCSVNILAILDETISIGDMKEIDMKQLNDNTKNIKRLSDAVESINIKIDGVNKELSEKLELTELSEKLKQKVEIDDFKKLDITIKKLESSQTENSNLIHTINDDLGMIKKEMESIKSLTTNIDDNQPSINDLIKWKNKINVLLIVIFLILGGFGLKFLF